MSAVLLFFAPTVVSAQTAPVETPAPTPVITTSQTAPTGANLVQAGTIGTPIAPVTGTAPGQVLLPVTSPQYVYPVAPPFPTAIPVQTTNPGGFTVQVTTQIGIPSQPGYPVMGTPGQVPVLNGQGLYAPIPGGYPVMPTQGGFVPGYPTGYPQPVPVMAQPGINSSVDAIANPALLPLTAQAVWQQIAASNPGSTQSLNSLQQLLREYPNFIPAYVQLAQGLIANNRTQEAISTLERGTTLYPNQPELARSLIVALGNSNRWTEAAMAARQFAIRNPNSPLVSEFTRLADESNRLAQSSSSSPRPARNSLLGNLLSAGMGYLLTGRLTSPITAPITNSPTGSWQSPWESSNPLPANNQAAQELLNRVQLLNDAEVSSYINEIGRRLAQSSGRSNFEFYVVRDRDTGAIALPDGKIFVSAGSIANTNSEAELATLIARQMGHSLLSHPDQVSRRSNLTGTLTRLLPVVGGLVSPRVREFNNSTMGTLVSGLMGNLSNNLLRPSYTSRMVNEANSTATKLLQAAGYGQGSLTNISSGGDRHAQMRTRVQQLLGSSTPWWSLGR